MKIISILYRLIILLSVVIIARGIDVNIEDFILQAREPIQINDPNLPGGPFEHPNPGGPQGPGSPVVVPPDTTERENPVNRTADFSTRVSTGQELSEDIIRKLRIQHESGLTYAVTSHHHPKRGRLTDYESRALTTFAQDGYGFGINHVGHLTIRGTSRPSATDFLIAFGRLEG